MDLSTNPRSPLYEAQHAARYERQVLIRNYEVEFGARFVVLCDTLFPLSVPLFEETIFDANPDEDLHMLLATPGGDGETAIRLVRQAQSRCQRPTVIVPAQAKSAGTLLALGANEILMSATSDLGPVDPQLQLRDGLYAAGKTIISAVEDAEARIQANPETFPLIAALLEDVTALHVQEARQGIARSGDQVREAIASHPDRTDQEVEELADALREPLINRPQSH